MNLEHDSTQNKNIYNCVFCMQRFHSRGGPVLHFGEMKFSRHTKLPRETCLIFSEFMIFTEVCSPLTKITNSNSKYEQPGERDDGSSCREQNLENVSTYAKNSQNGKLASFGPFV